MLTRADLAKYPFLSEASDYVRELGLSIEELSAPEFSPVLDRAERRLEEALSKGRVSGDITNESAEILSFPVSNLILSLVGEERARRRFALAESKRAYELLRQEDPDKLEYIASTTFVWKVKRLDIKLGKRFYDFALSLPDFLHNSVHLREPRWNLPNRVLDHGFVYVTRDEAARLMEEEVRTKILERSSRTPNEVPKLLGSRVERARGLVVKWLGVPTKFELPEVPMPEAMPPCVRHLIDSLDEGKNVQHMGRFTLASFLLNIGTGEEDVVKQSETPSATTNQNHEPSPTRVQNANPTEQLIRRKFQEYYLSLNKEFYIPPHPEEREYGFLLFKEKFMVRHRAFRDPSILLGAIRDLVPAHVYFSTAYYQEPT